MKVRALENKCRTVYTLRNEKELRGTGLSVFNDKFSAARCSTVWTTKLSDGENQMCAARPAGARQGAITPTFTYQIYLLQTDFNPSPPEALPFAVNTKS